MKNDVHKRSRSDATAEVCEVTVPPCKKPKPSAQTASSSANIVHSCDVTIVDNNLTVENANDAEVSDTVVIATRSTARPTEKNGAMPSCRWGHTLCMTNESEAILVGGQGDRHVFCKDSIWQLDFAQGSWVVPDTTTSSVKPESRMGHTTVYDPTVRCLYLFGGSKNKKWFNDIHVLDVDEWKWQLIKANGKAPTRAYHSATLYCHELWIFGGVYPQPDPQPDGCSNDLFVFSPLEDGWYTPLVMGKKPLPRSGHSATLLENKLVIFGGWDAPICYNDVHVLDFSLVEWSQPKVSGPIPTPRSWHSSCALSGNRILIHGGYNGNNALDDCFIFNLDTSTWISVQLEEPISPRAGHVALCLPYRHENNQHDDVVLFAGGNNDGAFYQDLVSLLVPCSNLRRSVLA